MTYIRTGAFLVIFLTFPLGSYGQTLQDPIDSIVQKMLASIKEIHSLTYVLRNSERLEGELVSAELTVKYHSQPKRCYIQMIRPNQGAELFYKDGTNQNQAIYNPTGFPYFTVNLDPLGEHLRDQNHHTLFEAGFAYIGQIVDQTYSKDASSFKYTGETTWEGRECHLVTIDYQNFGFQEYLVGDGETTRDVAQKLHLNEYKIVEMNPDVKKFGLIKKGSKISVPNCYARKMELAIDKEYNLPIQQKIYDDLGLFEIYEFISLSMNPQLDESEFELKGSKNKLRN